MSEQPQQQPEAEPQPQQPQPEQHEAPAGGGGDAQAAALAALRQQLAAKDEQIAKLSRQLEHFRGWLSGLQGQLQTKDPQAIKNARRLYVGGIPDGIQEVCVRHALVGGCGACR